jgi:hypothetical protein
MAVIPIQKTLRVICLCVFTQLQNHKNTRNSQLRRGPLLLFVVHDLVKERGEIRQKEHLVCDQFRSTRVCVLFVSELNSLMGFHTFSLTALLFNFRRSRAESAISL